ncbi:hypothetical protein HDE78_003018 [Rhodanobacter sp. K2T2]|uniref:hypothetical protein n=1 Tax=Rhodanobacter sp. K2T2 TaxID=2723085 RepID=UPI0015CB709D|nr:hypothetical protein [Rhodanobacter sp. K2T2]NYE30050.1 hypothetical protein [Rhodanobacter sp. K2T2]
MAALRSALTYRVATFTGQVAHLLIVNKSSQQMNFSLAEHVKTAVQGLHDDDRRWVLAEVDVLLHSFGILPVANVENSKTRSEPPENL